MVRHFQIMPRSLGVQAHSHIHKLAAGTSHRAPAAAASASPSTFGLQQQPADHDDFMMWPGSFRVPVPHQQHTHTELPSSTSDMLDLNLKL